MVTFATSVVGTSPRKLEPFRPAPAARIGPEERKDLALHVLARDRPVTRLAAELHVSRKFAYRQAAKASDALDAAFARWGSHRKMVCHPANDEFRRFGTAPSIRSPSCLAELACAVRPKAHSTHGAWYRHQRIGPLRSSVGRLRGAFVLVELSARETLNLLRPRLKRLIGTRTRCWQ